MDLKSKKNDSEQSLNNQKKSNKPQTSFKLVQTLCSLIAVIALIIASVAIVKIQQINKLAQTQNTKAAEEMSLIKSKLEKTSKAIDDTLQLVKKAQINLDTQLQSAHKSIENALKQQHYKTKDWLLIKANHYLQLAQINLHWDGDINSSISLLQAADKIVRKINSPSLLTLRQSIAKEVASLKALPAIDKTGLLSKLDAIKSQLAQLPLSNSQFELQKPPQEKVKNESSHWQQTLDSNLKSLKQLVIIRHRNQPYKPLLSPLQQSLINQSMQLGLQQAQWAVIHQNQAVYEFSLKQTIETIKQHYDTTAPQTRASIKQIQQLQAEKISLNYPDISKSRQLLQDYLNNAKESNS
jgi:uroporphyrin-III C-methyltransferase